MEIPLLEYVIANDRSYPSMATVHQCWDAYGPAGGRSDVGQVIDAELV